MKVAVFDPGGTTGYCIGTVSHEPRLLEYGEFPDSSRVIELIEQCDVVVSEQLSVGRLGFNTIGIEVMGAIKCVAAHRSIALTLQRPATMQYPLKWGCLDPSEYPSEHTKDAVCHYVAFLASVKIHGENVIAPSRFKVSVKGIPFVRTT